MRDPHATMPGDLKRGRMESLAAAENLSIELAPEAWRLLRHDLHATQELLHARTDDILRYSPDFAWTRRLPVGGSLAGTHIEQVVLGWSESDESWHLGLLLAERLAALRDSRWCELAHWPDPDQCDFRDLATSAGQALANVTARPFGLIEPQARAMPAPPTQPAVEDAPPPLPERPLPGLPLNFSNAWTLTPGRAGMLELVLNPQQRRRTIRQTLWYLLWILVYVFLIVASHFSGIAQTGPWFLPWLAGLSALILAALVARNLIRLRRSPSHLIFDSVQGQIRALHGMNLLWSRRVEQIQSLYVTELVRQRRGRDSHLQYAELHLHLSSNAFQHLLHSNMPRKISREPEALPQGVSQLTAQHCSTNTQAIALHIGKALDLPVWLDRRNS